MNNVIKHSQSGSIITIKAEHISGSAIIETISHSSTIGMDKLNEMVNKFRTTSSVDDNTLSEMDLISTKKLVETMNGIFTYYGDSKIGNYFKIEFPSTQ